MTETCYETQDDRPPGELRNTPKGIDEANGHHDLLPKYHNSIHCARGGYPRGAQLAESMMDAKQKTSRGLTLAHAAAIKQREALALLAQAAEVTDANRDGTMGVGHCDYLSWAHQIEEMLSCDEGEAGIESTLQKITGKND